MQRSSLRNSPLVIALIMLAGPWMAASGRAAEIHVPIQQPTIQAGINAAVNGDEVVIADGIYAGAGNVNCNFGGKLITVRSASGNPEACIIDCQNAANTRGFTFATAETNAAVLSGLTITNGNQVLGGAISISGTAAPTISQCDFINNTSNNGGAILTTASSGLGLTIRSCRFVGNSASTRGGAVNAAAGNTMIVNSLFNNNVAHFSGGAVNVLGSNTTVQIANCTMLSNHTTSKDPRDGGGAIGILTTANAVTVANSIVLDNVPNQIVNFGAATLTVSYSNIDNGWAGVGNLSDGALFTDQLGPDQIAGTFDDDLSIRSFSPCADSGDNSLVPAGILTDLAGNPRFADDPNSPDLGNGTSPLVDMGCYEVQAKVDPPDTCPADIGPGDGDDVVDIDDLFMLLAAWGPCS
jgi:predicted outer membrane repeat protein